jgi:hypothetical protein
VLLEPRIDPADCIHDFSSPREVLLPPLDIPPLRWICANLPNVTDLVRELYDLGSRREVRRMLHLKPFPDAFVEVLVVGDLADQIIDDRTELLPQLVMRGLRVLEGVVKYRRRQNIGVVHLTHIGDQSSDFDTMTYIGTLGPSLPTLPAVFVRREFRSSENKCDI